MIRLTYSNHTDALLGCLAQSIRIERQIKTIWEPIQLLVPNPTIKDYVRIQMAQHFGIAANLHFNYLEDIGQNLLVAKNHHKITIESLNMALLGVLGDTARLAKSCLNPVRHYLSHDVTGLKMVQLASQLANLYDSYDLSHPAWINAWRKKQHVPTSSQATEAWQRHLWLKATASLDKTGTHHLALSEIVRLPNASINNLHPNIHAFCFTHIAQTYYQAFARLGELGNLHIYTVNPCQEFWEDLATNSGIAQHVTKNYNNQDGKEVLASNESNNNNQNYYETNLVEPETLRLWGGAGQKGIRSLNNISQYDFETCFNIPKSKMLLGVLQKDILLFENSSTNQERTLDTSIHFWACPSQRREAEVLATEIWRLLELHSNTDQPLSFSDIAVVIPQNEKESYVANIQAAFQETHEIPWTQKNSTPSILTEIIDATKLLMDLPISSFTRIDIMRVITHPAITKNFGTINAETWTEWYNALGTIHKEESCKFTKTNTNKRKTGKEHEHLAPSLFIANSAASHNNACNYQPLATSSAKRFLATVRILIDDATRLLQEHKEPKDWSARLKHYLSTWLSPNNKNTTLVIKQMLNSLSYALESAPKELPTPKLSYTATRFLIIETITKLCNQQPCSLTGGVVVSCITQICSIPFRAVFVLGLGEDAVLGTYTRSAIDLRLTEHKSGDVTQTEKEQYLLLETLILTKEHLYISYVDQDQLTGTPLEPSCLFKELIAIVKSYRKVNTADIQHHPLHRFDPVYFQEWFSTKEQTITRVYNYSPIAQSEARALWLGRNIRQNKSLKLSLSAEIDLATSLGLKIKTHMTLNSQKNINTNGHNYNTTLFIADLIKWLECPLTGVAAIRLGLRSNINEQLPVEDEIFVSSTLDTHNLLREATLYSAYSSCKPDEIYDTIIRNLQSQGRSPFGLLTETERNYNLALIHAWLTLIKGMRPETWHFGPMQIGKSIANNHLPQLSLKVPIRGEEHSINLVGSLRPQLWSGSVFFEIGKPPKSNLEAIQKKALRAYVDQMVLSCIANNTAEHRAWFLFSGEEGNNPEVRSITFKPTSEAQSRKVLSDWIQDIFENDHTTLMPIEAILAANNEGVPTNEKYISNYAEAHINSNNGGFSSMYGPVPNLLSYSPPKNLMATIDRRMSNFLSQIHTFDVWK